MSSRSTGASGANGFERIDNDRQLLVFDKHTLCRVGRDIAVGGDDKGDFLILKQHLVFGEHGLNIAGQSRHVVQSERLQVLHGKHCNDAGQGLRLRGVDRFDPRMAEWRADEIAEQHARQLPVIDVVALALDEADVLDAPTFAAQAFERFRAFERGEFDGLVHSAASLNVPPSILAAAY